MNRCNVCHIQVADNTTICPLCQSVLEVGEVTNSSELSNKYPDILYKRRKLQVFCSMLLVFFILSEAIMVWWNITTFPQFMWSIIPGCLYANAYLLMHFFVFGTRGSYVVDYCVILLLIIGAMDFMDFFVETEGWSVSYTQPIVLLIANAVVLILLIFSRRNWQSYIVLELLLILLSISCVPRILIGRIRNPIYCLLAIGVSIFLFLGTMIIGGDRAKEELKRKFHV